MIEEIKRFISEDEYLANLLEQMSEQAQIYLLAKQRQKGCDEMGEVATLKEEFREAVDEVVEYCKGKKILPDDISYDIDSIASELTRINND
jgi:hypothetical protein